tara:strand:- start:404 stop:682 length:279 start_codon:yes stop_codon:yes gene_type:complete
MNIKNLKDFLKERLLGEEDFSQVQKNTFKFTECGAYIEEDEDGIAIGSIIEGSDLETSKTFLRYPFEIQEFWDALEATEKEAQQLWDMEHNQ